MKKALITLIFGIIPIILSAQFGVCSFTFKTNSRTWSTVTVDSERNELNLYWPESKRLEKIAISGKKKIEIIDYMRALVGEEITTSEVLEGSQYEGHESDFDISVASGDFMCSLSLKSGSKLERTLSDYFSVLVEDLKQTESNKPEVTTP